MSNDKKPVEKEPLKVEVVPADGKSDAEKASEAETQEPDNAENRANSYLPPQEGVNQNAAEEK